jgi:hypothetical protein
MKVTGQWKGVNVDLNLLTRRVESFFKSKGLYAKGESCKGGFKVCVFQNPRSRDICVEILGDSKNFQVNFILNEKFVSTSLLASVFSIFFGGGVLLKTLKLREFFEKLEREFWVYLNEAIEELNAFKDR